MRKDCEPDLKLAWFSYAIVPVVGPLIDGAVAGAVAKAVGF